MTVTLPPAALAGIAINTPVTSQVFTPFIRPGLLDVVEHNAETTCVL